METLNSTNCIFHLLNKANRSGLRVWKSYVKELGLTAVQAKILSSLYEKDDVTISELAQRNALDNASLTGLIDRMESQKLLMRQPYERDRRVISVKLTQDGKEIAELANAAIAPSNREFLNKLSKDEQVILRKLLSNLD
jgi:DNA-binding MarR family transcriptional regulator